MQEVAVKLEEKAAQLTGDEKNKLGQILVLKSLSTMYAYCHRAEVNKMSGGDNEGAAPSMTPVWEAFEKRAMMMQALVGRDVQPTSVDGDSVAPPPEPVQEQQATPPEAPQQTAAQPEQPQQVTSAPAQPKPPAPTAPAGAGPMGFFKPGANKSTATTAPAAEKEAPSQQAPSQPAETKPEEVAKTKDATANNFDNKSAPPSNPMGFFKPGTKKEDEK